jgi:urea transport system permease protein
MTTLPEPGSSRASRFTLHAFASKWVGERLEAGLVPVLILVAVYMPFAYFVVPETNALHLSLFGINLIGQIMCFALLALALDLVWGYAGILSLGHGVFFGIGGSTARMPKRTCCRTSCSTWAQATFPRRGSCSRGSTSR